MASDKEGIVVGTSNRYWTVADEASITIDRVTASWGRGEYCVTKVQALNFSFHLFYDAKTTIFQCTNPNLRSGMLKELHDCAWAGWGRGVSDLDEGFEHLLDNNGSWTDNNTKNYYGGPRKVFRAANAILQAPECATNFLAAVDTRMANVQSAMGRYGELVGRLGTQREQQRPWEELKGTLDEMKTGLDRVKHFLWWTPRVRTGVEFGSSAIDVVTGFGDAIDMYDRGIRAGMDPGLSASLVGLRQVMRFVPVLGDMYGSIVEGIPNLVDWYSGLIRNRVQQIERATRER